MYDLSEGYSKAKISSKLIMNYLIVAEEKRRPSSRIFKNENK